MAGSETPTLVTERLELRPLRLSDSIAIQRIFPRWEVVRLLLAGVPWPYPEDGALSFVRDGTLPAVDRGEEWAWTIRPRSDPDAVIGGISLFAKETENRGFWLGLDWQGQGLMSEACAATTRFWFDTLGRTVLRELKASDNAASRRISEREGMRMVWQGQRDFVSGRLPAEIWELSAEEWRRGGGGGIRS
jgi:RimJ/RimL family protein N-acetyltransferase